MMQWQLSSYLYQSPSVSSLPCNGKQRDRNGERALHDRSSPSPIAAHADSSDPHAAADAREKTEHGRKSNTVSGQYKKSQWNFPH